MNVNGATRATVERQDEVL